MSINKKKVLIIAPFHHGIGGAETYLYELMEIASNRFDISLASLAKPPETWQGTPISKVTGICWELLCDALRYRKLDIKTVDCHGLQAALVGVILGQYFKFKMCVTMLALYDFKDRPWWFRFACRWILNHADKIFVEGDTGKKDLLDCGVREDKIVKFMHWVDLDTYKPAPRKHKGVHVLFVGRPIPIKGKHIIEEVERKLFYLKELQFRYIENCPHKDLMQHYQWADILVVPSQYSEGFPRVVFEGAACGCAVIASNYGALPELLKDFGFTVWPNSQWQREKKAWTFDNSILALYKNKKALRWHQYASRLYANRYFTPKNAETILKEYE